MEEDSGENARGSIPHAPPVRQNKGNEPILPSDNDPPVDDELSFGSSPLPDPSPPKNNEGAESRKRPSHRSNRYVSGTEYEEKPVESDGSRSKPPKICPRGTGGIASQHLFMYPNLGAAPAPHMLPSTTVQGPGDMLSSPLGQHILSYEPPRDFVIPSFSMYDGSSDPYDHMLHFNQAMILNAGNDRLL